MNDFIRASLSPREIQLAEALLEGMDSSAIAKHLGLSLSTVQHGLGDMYKRFGIRKGIKRITLARQLMCI